MALPHRTTGSLRPAFASARRVRLAVKPPYAFTLYGRFPIGLRGPLRASVTFWEATAPVKLPTRQCPRPRARPGLEAQIKQGGIPLLAPPELAPRFQSLPPMLYNLTRDSLPSCSEGSQGLSVPPRVKGICTPTPFSLSPWLRQCESRYAFRAGRNLPDKEFRYLRTVIVTAAVYWGFGSELHPAFRRN